MATGDVARAAVMLALSGVVVLLAQHSSALRGQLAERDRAQRAPSRGAFLPDLPSRAIDGSDVAWSYGAGEPPIVLFVFTAECPYCAEAAATWNEIAARAHTSARILGLSLSDAAASERFVRDHRLMFPVGIVDDRVQALLRAHVVPIVLTASGQGRIAAVWVGALDHAGVTPDSVMSVIASLLVD
jgi:peroxiredoxin